jgi:hypothetical protein
MDVFEQGMAPTLREEVEPPDFDVPFQPLHTVSTDGVGDLGNFFKNPVHPVHGGPSPLNDIDGPTESHHGPGEEAEVAHESYEITDRDRLKNGQLSTEVKDNGHREVGEEQDEREKGSPGLCYVHIFPDIILAHLK